MLRRRRPLADPPDSGGATAAAVQASLDEARRHHRLLAMRAAELAASQKQLDARLHLAEATVAQLRSDAGRVKAALNGARSTGAQDEERRRRSELERMTGRLALALGDVEALRDAQERTAGLTATTQATLDEHLAVLRRYATECEALLVTLRQVEAHERAARALHHAGGAGTDNLRALRSQLDDRWVRARASLEVAGLAGRSGGSA